MLAAFTSFDHAVMSAIQSLYVWGGAWMDRLFLGCTFLGEEMLVILLLMGIYWCWDKKLGEYMLFSLFTAMSLNGIIKDSVCRLRPFQNPDFADLRYVKVDGSLVNTADLGSSYSFPSGHSQTAGSIYGSLARARKPGLKVLCGVLILLVMLSRVYLGVHYPTDTIAGALLGLLAAWVCGFLFYRLYDYRLLLMAAAVALSGVTLLIDFTADTAKTIGMGVGALIGMALETRFVRFHNRRGLLGCTVRLLLGFALLMALRIGLKAAFPDIIWFHMLRYAVIGFAGTYLWPLIFERVGL